MVAHVDETNDIRNIFTRERVGYDSWYSSHDIELPDETNIIFGDIKLTFALSFNEHNIMYT